VPPKGELNVENNDMVANEQEECNMGMELPTTNDMGPSIQLDEVAEEQEECNMDMELPTTNDNKDINLSATSKNIKEPPMQRKNTQICFECWVKTFLDISGLSLPCRLRAMTPKFASSFSKN
jgi:hypothetical protein